MRVQRIGGFNIGIVSSEDLLNKHYSPDRVNLNSYKWEGRRRLSKSYEKKRMILAPYSMANLLKLIEKDEYHSGCITSKVNTCLMQIEVKNSSLKSWFSDAQYPGNDDIISTLGELLKYYLACGNGFIIKMRSASGDWVGLERLLPTEVQLIENYDEFGFFKPDFLHVKNGTKRFFSCDDVIDRKSVV